jgi:HEAT repeat protein
MDEEIRQLGSALTDPDPTIRGQALDRVIAVLREKRLDQALSEPLLPLVVDEDVEVRRKATWAIGRLALGKQGADRSLAALVKALGDEDVEVRENATWALGELAGVGIGTETSLPPLNGLLKDENRQVVGMAAWALGRLAERADLCDRSSVGALRELKGDTSTYVSKGADWALQRIFERRPEWDSDRY